MVALVMSHSGLVHQVGCYAIKRAYRGLAPEIAEADVAGFLEARRLTPCGACLGKYRTTA